MLGEMRRLVPLVLAVSGALAVAGAAGASQLIDRNASGTKLAVNTKGEALLTYRASGKLKHILVWGALAARQPDSGLPQQRFKKDYAGGWGKYRTTYWATFRNTCRAYDGPPLAFFVTACKAPDGSYWAVQSWQTPLPDLGFTPWAPALSAYELHISHWTGPLAKLEVWSDWIYGGRFHDLFGRLTYDGRPVYGFGTTNVGAPTDGYGRLVYLDTLDAPAYGTGWRRENSFVSHNPTGIFCYGFYPFDPTKGGYIHPPGETAMRGPGIGSQYRLTVEGPGVTPDISTTIADPGDYDPGDPAKIAYEKQQNALLDSILDGDKLCRQH
jgi:hypothetical protein